MPVYFEYLAFNAHIALALSLIALVAGCYLFTNTCSEGACCKPLSKIIGIIAMVLAAASLICVLYISTKRCCDKNAPPKAVPWHHPPIGESME